MTLTPTGGKKYCKLHSILGTEREADDCPECQEVRDTRTPEVVQEDWEKEFDDRFVIHLHDGAGRGGTQTRWEMFGEKYDLPKEVKSFISSLIKAKEEVARHEGWENGMNSMGVESLKEQLRDEGRFEILARIEKQYVVHPVYIYKPELESFLSSLRENEK